MDYHKQSDLLKRLELSQELKYSICFDQRLIDSVVINQQSEQIIFLSCKMLEAVGHVPERKTSDTLFRADRRVSMQIHFISLTNFMVVVLIFYINWHICRCSLYIHKLLNYC